jgi:hypothetical protein
MIQFVNGCPEQLEGIVATFGVVCFGQSVLFDVIQNFFYFAKVAALKEHYRLKQFRAHFLFCFCVHFISFFAFVVSQTALAGVKAGVRRFCR